MRYLDWDVLLFPESGTVTEANSNDIPLQEFKTTCYAVKESASHAGSVQHGKAAKDAKVTPLLTCFIPTQSARTIFYISLHCWSPATLRFPSIPDEHSVTTKVWQIKILIDGLCVANEMLQLDKSWPYKITMTNTVGPDGQSQPLRFPSFVTSTASNKAFNAAEDLGRIKVELSAGYITQRNGVTTFSTIEKIICFSFAHAPMYHLVRCGIAWPNPAMYSNPIEPPTSTCNQDTVTTRQAPSTVAPRDLSSPLRKMPAAPPTTPASILTSPYIIYTPDDFCYDLANSRDSSHSHMNSTTLHPSTTQLTRLPTPSSSLQGLARQASGMLHLSAPSQLLSSTRLDKNMPPPPLPSRINNTKDMSLSRTGFTPINMRNASYSSDISMHTGCNAFPTCTSEDEHGCLQHKSPAAPVTVVRSKKEPATQPTAKTPTTTIKHNTASLQNTSSSRIDSVVRSPDKSVPLWPSSPPESVSTSKKRKGSALRSSTIANGSPVKIKLKLSRKSSKTFAEDADKENVPMSHMEQELGMSVDG